MSIHYAADRSPPAAKLVAFTVRTARDEFVRQDRAHRERTVRDHCMALAEQGAIEVHRTPGKAANVYRRVQ